MNLRDALTNYGIVTPYVDTDQDRHWHYMVTSI